MAGVVLVNPKNQFHGSDGAPLAGGTVTVYWAGTTTLATTYQDKALTSANTNPISLNARGECSIWADSGSTYKYVVKDSDGATIYTEDNIPGAADVGTAATAAAAAALASEVAAELAETNAEAAAAAAETAVDSLITAANIFDDTTAGVAGTASGARFWVESANTEESYIGYKDNAGVAEEKKRLPAALAVTQQRNETDLASLPPGPRAVWMMDRFQTAGRNFVPNSVAPAVSAQYNLLSAPRHLFNNTSFYSKLNAPTVTDDNVAGPLSLTDAARVVGGAVDWGLFWSLLTLPAGTYTLVVEVMSNTGVSQDFQMGGFTSGGLQTKTATTSYQRFTHTFTRVGSGTEVLNIIRAKTSAAGDFRLYEACLFSGSADLGRQTLVGHLVFGPDAYNLQPTYASGAITLGNSTGTSAKFGLAQFDSYNTAYEFTVLAVGKRKGAPFAADYYQVAVCSIDSFNRLTATFADGLDAGPVLAFGGSGSGVGTAEVIGTHKAGLWSYKNDDIEMIGSRYDGAKGTLWRGDVRAVEGSSSALTASLRDLVIGAIIGGQSANYAIYAVAYYERALTDAEMRSGYLALKSRVLNKSAATIIEPRFLCAEGDSITFGTGSGVTASYAHVFGANSSPQVDGVVPAVASATLLTAYEIIAGNSLQTRAAYIDAMIPASKRGRKFVLSLLVGNDFVNGYTDATAYAVAVSAYCALRKAAGWDKIVLITCLPRTTANFNTRRNAFNTIVRAGPWAAANSVDAICDFGADATYGVDAAASDVAKYPDGVHPSQTAQTALEVLYRATVNAL